MVNKALSKSYLNRARIRIHILKEYMKVNDYADAIRESQEIVELLQKAILIALGVQPPKWHDVSDIILENKEKLPKPWRESFESSLRKNSKWLRSQREISFYGDMDFIPEESYTEGDAERAISTAKEFLKMAEEMVGI